ncbi:hypothetical protein EVAR_92342_1 [Eumeta japonica]|uniref:Uncharacterized protein n=1 Tax=Eumeta variegata TaxID=151549 RepID=A0A4C1TIJ9_EUMVA|nr:hypothetical protein EVAR_92342_1 [Eumeta japonica]
MGPPAGGCPKPTRTALPVSHYFRGNFLVSCPTLAVRAGARVCAMHFLLPPRRKREDKKAIGSHLQSSNSRRALRTTAVLVTAAYARPELSATAVL